MTTSCLSLKDSTARTVPRKRGSRHNVASRTQSYAIGDTIADGEGFGLFGLHCGIPFDLVRRRVTARHGVGRVSI